MDWSAYAELMIAPEFRTPELGRIYNGIMTLTLPDGGHRTFRVRTGYPGTKFAGRRLIGILVGPDNTGDYEEFAFLIPDGFQIFKRILGTPDAASAYRRYADILWRLAGGEEIEGYEVHESRKCLRCNRLLTDDESIMLGIGPTCRGKT